ncbi:PREDICTED: uncharacterized protein LOC109223996 isoform X2 [Nicotiana attenuata]|uniref:uncharacterized protein LOC109223996 isoform X2 n=1 Tax=Nicotiana attenuata TaxID=49451 RepID=UPI000904A62B|nr:PREDICTED: uncharacterized protein LOC109223996 isoform X2 [Nicotiana attenuata]
MLKLIVALVVISNFQFMALAPSPRQTYIPLPSSNSGRRHVDHEVVLKPVPIFIVTHESQLPATFLNPSPKNELVVGLDCEGVDLCRYGTLCIVQALYYQFDIKLHNVMDTQIAYYLIEEQLGKKRAPDDHISFVRLLADPRYCGISYVEKKEVRSLLREDPQFWTYRPLSELMVRAAADDVRFLPYIFHKMMEKLSEQSLWRLAVRGSLCSRCFCISDNGYADWPAIPSIPEFLNVERDTLEEEILSVLDVPARKMGCVIGRKGSSILSIKESCKAEILIGGSKGTPDKVFIIGPLKQVRKAEAILRGRML